MNRDALLVALSAALITAPAVAEPVVLEPSSKWEVDFGADRCRLLRTFGEGENEHFFAMQQFWPAKVAGLTVAGPSYRKFRSLARTEVRFSETQEPLRATPFTGTIEGYGPGVIFSALSLDEGEPPANEPDEPSDLQFRQLDPELGKQAQFLDVRQGAQQVRLKTGPMGEAFKVLNQCTLDLLREWGLDPALHQTSQRGPRMLNQDALVRKIIADYPSDALLMGEQGIMRMRLIVSAEGTVESCTIIKATNTAKLESPACKVMERARFEPALDAQGQPFRSFYATSITYRIG